MAAPCQSVEGNLCDPVATDMACRDAVRDGDNGLLVPVKDAPALATAMRRLLDDAALRQRMGARGRARAVAEFGQQRVIEATLAVYAEVRRSSRNAPGMAGS